MKRASRFALALASVLTGCSTVIPLGGAADQPAPDAGTGGPDAGAEGGSAVDAPRCRDLAVGNVTHSLTHAGRVRKYQVIRSASVDTCTKMRAVFAFHALDSGSTSDSARRLLIAAAADRAGALSIFVEGAASTNGQTGWSCAGCAAFAGSDDVGLVRRIVNDIGLDPRRLTAVGVDQGGSFVHRLAAELPLAGAFVLSGALVETAGGDVASVVRPTPTAPVTIVLEHGELDPVFPIDGGTGNRGEAMSPFAEAVSFWQAASGCANAPIVAMTAATTSTTLACQAASVLSVRWKSAKHAVPDTDPDDSQLAFTAVLDRLLALP